MYYFFNKRTGLISCKTRKKAVELMHEVEKNIESSADKTERYDNKAE